MSALTDLFTAFANKIRSKTGGSDTYTPPQMVNAIDDVYQAGVDAGTTPTQTKTVTAGTSATTVTPDTGYALSSVTVNPTPSQSKSATPMTSSQTITPDSGKLLSSVSVGAIQTETKSDTPNVSTNKTVSPSSGKYLSQVTIQPLTHSGTYTPAANTAQNDMGAYHDKRYVNTSGMIVPSGNKSITANGTGIDVKSYATASVNVPNPTLSGDAAVGNVLSGKTFYNSDYTKRTGTMTNNGAVSPTALSAGGSYTVPAGYHNGSGVVSAKTLASQTGVDSGKTAIDASHVHSGYQGWVNGNKVSGTYTAPTITNITPSDSTPVALETTKNYNPSTTGYAVKNSPTQITQNELNAGVYFTSGLKNMPSSGYAYSSKAYKNGWDGDTTLWSNSATTSNFTGKAVTLSQSMANFTYLQFEWRNSTANSTTSHLIIPVSEFQQMTDANSYNFISLSSRGTANGYRCYRRTYYVSDTSVQINDSINASANTYNQYAIPLSIKGLK